MNFKIIAGLAALLLCANSLSAQNIGKYKQHIDTLASKSFAGRKPSTLGDTLSVRYITSQLKQIDGIELLANGGLQEVPYKVRARKAEDKEKSLTTFNVVARITAPAKRNKKGEHVIIGSHYDHEGTIINREGKTEIYYGADDNASGISFLIELAREIAHNRSKLTSDVVFVWFGGEEMGMVGSSYYASNPLVELNKAVAMVNFDMLGRMTRKGITIRGTGTAEEYVGILSSLANPDSLEIIWEMRGNGPTDYSQFYAKGVPAISFSTRQHSDYHTPRDTASKINYEGMAMAYKYIMPLISTLVFDTPKLTYKSL